MVTKVEREEIILPQSAGVDEELYEKKIVKQPVQNLDVSLDVHTPDPSPYSCFFCGRHLKNENDECNC